MKCHRHPGVDAVVQCNQCGRGLCDSCSQSYYGITHGGARNVICGVCYEDIESRRKAQASKDYSRHMFSAVWSGIWSAIGLFLLITNQANGGDWLAACMIPWFIGGLAPGVVAAWRKARNPTLFDEIVVGTSFGTGNEGQGCLWMLIPLIGHLIVATLACPFLCLYYLYKASAAKKAGKTEDADDASVQHTQRHSPSEPRENPRNQPEPWSAEWCAKEVGGDFLNYDAARRLGSLYLEGKGVDEDHANAAQWFYLASERDVEANTGLGMCYAEGKGVEKDEMAAMRYFRRAVLFASNGGQNSIENASDAAFSLAKCYQLGFVNGPDIGKAEKWYRLASDLGDDEAIKELHYMGISHKPIPADRRRARLDAMADDPEIKDDQQYHSKHWAKFYERYSSCYYYSLDLLDLRASNGPIPLERLKTLVEVGVTLQTADGEKREFPKEFYIAPLFAGHTSLDAQITRKNAWQLNTDSPAWQNITPRPIAEQNIPFYADTDSPPALPLPLAPPFNCVYDKDGKFTVRISRESSPSSASYHTPSTQAAPVSYDSYNKQFSSTSKNDKRASKIAIGAGIIVLLLAVPGVFIYQQQQQKAEARESKEIEDRGRAYEAANAETQRRIAEINARQTEEARNKSREAASAMEQKRIAETAAHQAALMKDKVWNYNTGNYVGSVSYHADGTYSERYRFMGGENKYESGIWKIEGDTLRKMSADGARLIDFYDIKSVTSSQMIVVLHDGSRRYTIVLTPGNPDDEVGKYAGKQAGAAPAPKPAAPAPKPAVSKIEELLKPGTMFLVQEPGTVFYITIDSLAPSGETVTWKLFTADTYDSNYVRTSAVRFDAAKDQAVLETNAARHAVVTQDTFLVWIRSDGTPTPFMRLTPKQAESTMNSITEAAKKRKIEEDVKQRREQIASLIKPGVILSGFIQNKGNATAIDEVLAGLKETLAEGRRYDIVIKIGGKTREFAATVEIDEKTTALRLRSRSASPPAPGTPAGSFLAAPSIDILLTFDARTTQFSHSGKDYVISLRFMKPDEIENAKRSGLLPF